MFVKPRLIGAVKKMIFLLCVCLPDVKCGIEDVGLFQSIKLNLAVTHLVVDALQLVIKLELLPFKLAVLLLVPYNTRQQRRYKLLRAVSSTMFHSQPFTLTVAPLCPAAESGSCSEPVPGPRRPSAPPQPRAPGPGPPPLP